MSPEMEARIEEFVANYKKKYRGYKARRIAEYHKLLRPKEGWEIYGDDMYGVIQVIYDRIKV